MPALLDLYDLLNIIGNGSFGIIHKARRKADGKIFACKEINFKTMSEEYRKHIVAEVTNLKDLRHEHIVQYIDRVIDYNAGILYILMEYCGGGDLSIAIKQAAKHNRLIPEDTIWSYFMQILLALHHCHHPNGSHGSRGSAATGNSGDRKRVQILHRDLKPDNVFLDENNVVKLGDFGLSKALVQVSFANTYVGTPYYMSPEVMQKRAYDSKSDVWSLGCLIYELCALKPPFHRAKTLVELDMCIRDGRIPPLPQGYSHALSNVIKSMLSLNPAMRPSAAQLLQDERLELMFKVSEKEKIVKARETAVINKEHKLRARESVFLQKERRFAAILGRKDAEVTALQERVAQIQRAGARYSQRDVEMAVLTAVEKREEEMRVAVMQREKEVQAVIAKRGQVVAEAVQKREQEAREAWVRREADITRKVEIEIQILKQSADAIKKKEEELKLEAARLSSMRKELEEKATRQDDSANARKEKSLNTPLARKDPRPSMNSGPPTARPSTRSSKPFLKASGRVSFAVPRITTPGKKVAKSRRKSQVAVVPPAVEPVQQSQSAFVPRDNLEDEDDLPSPFLKPAERKEGD